MNITHAAGLLALFLAVAGLAYGLSAALLRSPVGSSAAPGTTGPDAGRWLTGLSGLTAPLARLALPSEGWERSPLRLRFLHAGLRHAAWPGLYFGAKALLALALPVLALLLLGVFSAAVAAQRGHTLALALIALAAAGYYLPDLALRWRVARRQRELLEAFPDAIDLLIVCLEAGLGLDAALARANEEMRLRSPALAEELQLVGLELRIGAARTRALRNLALRTGLEEASSLVAMLVQAERFGTSIAEALRVHARSLRTRRRLRAEEAAAKIPLKLLFPLIFCIFPSLLLVLMGPAGISLYRVLLKGG